MVLNEGEVNYVEKNNEDDEIKGATIDHYLEMVNPPNRPGRYQSMQFAILCTLWAVPMMAGMSGIYDAYSPPHHCKVDNMSQIPEDFDPLLNGMKRRSCEMYRYANWTDHGTNESAAEVVPCQNGWTYDRSQFDESFISEYNLVCKSNIYFETMRTAAGVITIPATLIISYLADKFGRRKVFIITFLIDRIASILYASLHMLAFIPVLAGIAALSAGEFLPLLIAYELFPARYRGFVGIACNVIWVVSACFIPVMGNFIRQWRTLSLSVSGIATAVGLVLFWFIPESPTWLISQQRFTEAEKLFRKIAKFNKIKLPEATIIQTEDLLKDSDKRSEKFGSTSSIPMTNCFYVRRKVDCCRQRDKVDDRERVKHWRQQDGEEKHGQRFSDLLRSRRMRIITLVVSGLFMVNALVYSGMFFLATYLPGNIHLNNFLIIIVELPAYIIAILAMPRLGRKWLTVGFQLLAGVGLVASVLEISDIGKQHTWIALVTAIIGKMGISGSYAVVYLYGPELFPTSLRSLGFSTCRVSEMVAQVILPYASIYLVKIAPWLPRVLFGGLAILISIPVVFLPETKGRPLPETIQEIETWH